MAIVGTLTVINDYRWILVPAVALFGLCIISSELQDSRGDNGGAVLTWLIVTCIAVYFAAKPKSYWTETC